MVWVTLLFYIQCIPCRKYLFLTLTCSKPTVLGHTCRLHWEIIYFTFHLPVAAGEKQNWRCMLGTGSMFQYGSLNSNQVQIWVGRLVRRTNRYRQYRQVSILAYRQKCGIGPSLHCMALCAHYTSTWGSIDVRTCWIYNLCGSIKIKLGDDQ